MVDPSTAFKANKKPTPPPKGRDEVDKDIYREEIKLYVAREATTGPLSGEVLLEEPTTTLSKALPPI